MECAEKDGQRSWPWSRRRGSCSPTGGGATSRAPLFAQILLPSSPFANPVPARVQHHVQPILVTEVAYTEVTETGTLRQPSIKGLRTDVLASEVTWDDEIAPCFLPKS